MEVDALDQVLRVDCNFTTHLKRIPSTDSEDLLIREVLAFRKGKRENDLLILYYGGHAVGTPKECIWRAFDRPDSPELNWHSVQHLLLDSPAHVLIILDCCFSALAANSYGKGDNWFLGSSAKESFATGVAWNSFTSVLTMEIRRWANQYRTDFNPFTLHSIHSALVIRERDLQYSPNIVRLTDHECDSTDLTPLLKNFDRPPLQASSTDPAAISQVPGPYAPSRPPLNHMTLPINSISPRPNLNNFVEHHGLPMDLTRGESQTARISGLPASTVPDDIVRWFNTRLDKSQPSLISRLGPIVTFKEKVTVITFTSVAITKQALAIQDRFFQARAEEGKKWITIDNHFQGLTCIYSSVESPDNQPTIDIVFVHGADGHAINSFARHHTGLSKELLWPCEELPKALESVGVFPRIMTFGWAADAWLDPSLSVHQACEDFAQALRFERSGCPKRPMVFVGHGLGGILIKQTVIEIINFGLIDPNFENPIKSCIFFAVPHRGLNHIEGFASILAKMHSVLQEGIPPDERLVRALRSRNTKISNISIEFDGIRNEHSIEIISLYEEQKTADDFIVPKDCAILDDKPGRVYGVASNYQDVVRFSPGSPNLRLVLDLMCSTLGTKRPNDRDENFSQLESKKESKPVPERVYPLLSRYDTVFLVDDSDSMYGVRWTTTARVLAKIASIAVEYDKDGVDIRFFNYYLEKEERLHLNTSQKVMDLFKQLEPAGPTPTASVLDEELTDYVVEFDKDRHRKGLNLIILTDGEPDKDEDVEGVIVKFANILKEKSAPLLKVGVQFVQIGGDEAATKFLKGLDDDLQKKHGLDRDVCFNLNSNSKADKLQMIDMVLWVEGDNDRLYEKILLGGILKRLDKQNS